MILLWILAGLVAWTLLSAGAGWLVGRTIHLADEQSEAELQAAMRRHPSGSARGAR